METEEGPHGLWRQATCSPVLLTRCSPYTDMPPPDSAPGSAGEDGRPGPSEGGGSPSPPGPVGGGPADPAPGPPTSTSTRSPSSRGRKSTPCATTGGVPRPAKAPGWAASRV